MTAQNSAEMLHVHEDDLEPSHLFSPGWGMLGSRGNLMSYHYIHLCDRLLEALLPDRPNVIAVDPRAFLLPSDSVR